jgi:hypothetical protein
MKIQRLLLGAAIVSGMVLTSGTSALAEQSGSATAEGSQVQQVSQERSRLVSSTIAQGQAKGSSWSDIKSDLEGMGIEKLPDVDPYGSSQVIRPQSFGDDVSVSTYGYYDSQVQQTAYVARYNWLNTNYESDAGALCSSPCEVGGLEAFGIALSAPLETVSTFGYFCTADRNCPELENAAQVSQLGVVYQQQDVLSATLGYTTYSGEVTYSTSDNSCGVQPFANYTHTWDDSEITGYSISPSDLSIAVSNVDKSFTVAVPGAGPC